MTNQYVSGVFLSECNNRFLCQVEINGYRELCYISNSSKLSRFIDLTGRDVLLIGNIDGKSKTKYTLHAVKTSSGYVLLNLGFVNKLLLQHLNEQKACADTIYREKKVLNKLRADFVICGGQDTIVEAKGILTEDSSVYYPAVVADRAIEQLIFFRALLKIGYAVHYSLVLMNPAIRDITLDKANTAFYRNFRACMRKGMNLFIYKSVWKDDTFLLVRDESLEGAFKAENALR